MRFIVLFVIIYIPSVIACEHTLYGTPLSSDQIICRAGYAVGYNYSRRSADWIAYHLTSDVANGSVERQNDFRPDDSIPLIYQAQVNDYLEPIYDMGHLVSSESLDLTIELNSETFLLSNITPQLPGLNRAAWKGLENRERKWATERGEVYVYVGMLYEGGDIVYINNRIPVPSHFFKVIYDPKTQDSISYLFPHKPIRTSELDKYLSSIDDIELRSGLNLLSVLDDITEEQLEHIKAIKQW